MNRSERYEFGENGVVRSADPLRSIDLDQNTNSLREARLRWRNPTVLFLFITWILAGPLNPAGLIAIQVLNDSFQFVVYMIALPSAVGAALVLWRLRARSVNLGDVFGSAFKWALLIIPVYIVLIVMAALGAQGLEESILMMFAKGASGLFVGLALSLAFGWYGLLFAVPAALAAVGVIRLVGLTRVR